MKQLFSIVLLLSTLLLGAQTARLDCYNCTKLPGEVCAPCLNGIASSEYSQGIMYSMGPSSKTFIKKPYTVTVKGVFITLTDYTGKNVTFDGTKTVHGSLVNTINVLNTCNCNVVGGGYVPGSFNLVGDTGQDSIAGSLSILSGPVLKTTVTSNTLTVDWDVAGTSSNSVPYYTGSSVGWRTFATGIVDDPTVGGSDATSLQTVLNNLNSGGGVSLSGDPRNIPYFNASGDPVDGNYFKLDSTASGVILRIGNPNNYHPIVGSALSIYNPKLQTYDNTAFGIERTFTSGGSGVVIGAAVSNPTLSFSHINGTYASPSNTSAGDVIGAIRTNALLAGSSEQSAASIFFRYTNNADVTNTKYETVINAASSSNASIEALVVKGNGLYLNGGGSDPKWYLPFQYPGTGTKKLQWVNNVPQWATDNTGVAEYNVAISGSNTGSFLRILASSTGVTAAFSSNVLTITIPSGVTVYSADWRMVSADVQASADAGGVTNWVQVVFVGTGGNTALTDLRVPAMQKVAIPSSGSLSTSNAATADLDNNPALSVVGVGSGNITLRVGGLSVGAQGYNLKFTNI